jgi:hypothetical protein
MGQIEQDFHSIWRGRFGDHPVGHYHFWDRALSRRQFLGTALASGAALSLPGLVPVVAEAASASSLPSGPTLPNPINGGTQLPPGLKHFYFPTAPNPAGATKVVADGSGDGSTIRDFKGSIGVSEFPPTGEVISDPFFSGKFWAADIRFMKGLYVGRDNARHRATFAFI